MSKLPYGYMALHSMNSTAEVGGKNLTLTSKVKYNWHLTSTHFLHTTKMMSKEIICLSF